VGLRALAATSIPTSISSTRFEAPGWNSSSCARLDTRDRDL
jgi:hypothetical protein